MYFSNSFELGHLKSLYFLEGTIFVCFLNSTIFMEVLLQNPSKIFSCKKDKLRDFTVIFSPVGSNLLPVFIIQHLSMLCLYFYNTFMKLMKIIMRWY